MGTLCGRCASIADTLIVEERPDGILLRGNRQDKVSMAQTFAEMAAEHEDWSEVRGPRMLEPATGMPAQVRPVCDATLQRIDGALRHIVMPGSPHVPRLPRCG